MMDCASCGQANRPAARFCSGCGSALVPRCPSCGAEHEPGARFCDACGATVIDTDGPLGPAATADTETRRVVTLVFADLIGSTTLHERIDAESARRVMASYYAAIGAAVEAHDGTVIKLLGDGVLAGFGVARVQEDDAVRAVRAALAMHDAMPGLTVEFGELAGELGLRVGVNTGEVVVSEQDDDVVGDPVNIAARLQQEARAGDVLIGDATRRLVDGVVTLEPAGEFALKGRTGAVAAHRVVSLERPATGPTTSFVGRDDELRRVMASYTTATVEREARLVIMVGSPGLGKSRLMDEVSRRLGGEASILTARCDVSGGPTFTPIADAIRAFVAVDSDDQSIDAMRAGFEALIGEGEGERDRIVNGAVALCAGEPGPPEETFWVVRRVLAALGQQRPVVLALDDLHWAEPLLLDLVEHLVEWSTDVPLLVLGAARPELRDTRSSLTTTAGVADVVIALDGLDAGAATRLAADAIGAVELPAAVAGRVLAASEGNPLFLGALVRMLVEDGALEWDGDRWVATVELDELEMPPTIHALLAARIDRLDPVVRLVLERASVIGRQFSREAVAYLLPPDLHGELDGTLEALRRSELIEPDDTWFLGEPAMRFHHALIRDAAYRRLLKDARADLHASFAEWLEQRVGEGTEQDEAIGLHFEQAYRHLDELGPLDERARNLGTRAAGRLAAEGRRALARDDLTVAAGLLGRAVSVLEPVDPQRADLSLDWCEALLAGGDVTDAPTAIAELDRWAETSERLQAWQTSFVGHLAVLTDPQRLRETADAVAAAAATLAALDDAAGEAKAYSVRALALARLGEVGACETALDQALVAARRADDRRRSNAVLAGAPVAALWGPSPVTRASGRCLDVVRVLRITAAAPAVEAVAMRCQAVLEALRGRGDAARRMIASSRRTVEELGLTIRILEADMAAGLIELVNGEPAAAEALLRRTYAGFRDRGLGVDAAQAGALLGRSLLALGRVSEAEAISHECEALAGHDLKAAIAWRGVRAEALARRGQYSDAIEIARDAVAIAAGTDALLDHADARVALAVALRVAGKHTEAEAETNAAFDLWSAKGATALMQTEAEEELSATPPAAPPKSPRLQRTVRPNWATANGDRMEAAIRAGDIDAFSEGLAPDFESRYHPLQLFGGRDEVIETFRRVFDASGAVRVERSDVATLGDALALRHQSMTYDSIDDGVNLFGASLMENFMLIEAGPDGRRRLGELFAPDQGSDAVVRLLERHAELVTDPEQRRAALALAESIKQAGPLELAELVRLLDDFDRPEQGRPPNLAFAALLTSERRWRARDWDGVLAVYDADVYVLDDRRSLIHLRSSGEEFIENLRFLFDDGAFTSTLVEGRGDRLALVRAEYISNRKGAFSSEHYTVAEADADGRLIAMVIFDTADVDGATAELDRRFSRSTGGAADVTTSTLAARASAAMVDAHRSRNWAALRALFAPDMIHDDRRSQYQMLLDLDAVIASNELIASTGAEVSFSLWETRGDRLVLERHLWTTPSIADGYGTLETEFLGVLEVGTDGRVFAIVTFDPEDRDGAYAELDRRYARSTSTAFSALQESERRWREGDWDGVLEMYDHEAYELDDRRSLMHMQLRGEQFVDTLRFLYGAGVFVSEFRDSRGEHLALAWEEYVSDNDDASEHLALAETNDAGLLVALVIFDAGDADAATAELDARFARRQSLSQLGQNSAIRVLTRLGEALEARDLDAVGHLLAPEFRAISHRSLFQHDSDRETHLIFLRVMTEVESFTTAMTVVATRGDRLAMTRLAFRGEDSSVSLGTSDIEWLQVTEVDGQGRCTLMTSFDLGDLDGAYAELERLYRERQADEGTNASPASMPRNAASRASDRNFEAFEAADWSALEALTVPNFAFQDHRNGMHTEFATQQWVESMQLMFASNARAERQQLAVLGEYVALEWVRWTGRSTELEADGAEFEVELLRVVQADDEGRLVAASIYDAPDRQAANDELWRLDEQTDEGQRIPAVIYESRRAFNQNDLTAMRATLRDDFVFDDRRRMGSGTLGADAYVESVAAVLGETDEMIPETLYRVAASTWGTLTVAHVVGRTKQGVDVEIAFLRLFMTDGELLTRVEIFELDDLELARSRFEALQRERSHNPSNAASRAVDRMFSFMSAANWPALEAMVSPEFSFRDHRIGIQSSLGIPEWIESMQLVVASGFQPERQRLSLLGDRLVLEKVRWRRAASDGAESWVEVLRIVEIDDHGLMTLASNYDADDRRAANDELWRLYEQSDEGQQIPAVIFENRHAFNHHDLKAMRATLRDDFVFDDHRRTGSGALPVDEYVASAAALLAETDDLMSETLYRVATSALGTLSVGNSIGTTTHGGDFENVFLRLFMTDGQLLTRVEIFELDDLERAKARFETLSREGDEGDVAAIRVPGNTASRASDRGFEFFYASDWSALEAMACPGFSFRDLRNGMHTELGTKQWLESMRLMVGWNARADRHLLSVLGDQVALERTRWFGLSEGSVEDGAAFEVELLGVVEVDDQGRFVSVSSYDVGDLRAANDELWRLYERSDEGQQTPASIFRNLQAFNHHDLDALRATLRDDFVFDDRRRTGSGALGADAYVESVAALLGETDDLIGETLYRVATNAWGTLSVGHIVGTTSHGGDFENLFVRLIMTDGDLLTRIEIFEVDDLEQAKSRFDELCPETVRRSSTLAARTLDRVDAASRILDWDAFGALLRDDMVFDERRSLMRNVGGGAAYLGVNRLAREAGAELDRTRLSSLGELLTLDHLRWTAPSTSKGAGEFEIELLAVHEVDSAGLVTGMVCFDTADRQAANDELWQRFRETAEGRALPPVVFDAANAVNHGDVDAFRALLHDDFAFVDRRPLGFDALGPETYVEFFEVLIAETSDYVYESVRILAMSPFGVVDLARLMGHTLDGATFERVFVRVTLAVDGRLSTMEVFPLAGEDAALARFEELQAQLQPAVRFDDLEAFRSMLADDCVLVDHRLLAAEPMDRDAYVEYFSALLEETSDVNYESLELLRETSEGVVELARLAGHSKDGAEFESVFVRVAMRRDGLFVVMEIFPPEERDLALARFAELQSDSTRTPATSATRVMDRYVTAFEARDRNAMIEVCSESVVYDDRRSLTHTVMGRDQWAASMTVGLQTNVHLQATNLSTLGDRLVLSHERWHGAFDGSSFDGETLTIREIDADGLIAAIVSFDIDDRVAANAELWRRFGAIEHGNPAVAAAGGALVATNGLDLDAVGAFLADDCIVFDHRSLAHEPMDRAQFLAYLGVLVDETSDFIYETIAVLRVERDGLVDLARLIGHSQDGGAFEKTYLRLTMARDGLIYAIGTFPLDAEAAALARFEELRPRPDPSRIPATSATRAVDRWEAALAADDRRAIEDLTTESLVFEDRRALNRTTGDLAAWKRTTEATLAANVRLERTVLSTLGDRLELERHYWTGEVDGAAIDGESLTIREVDASGHLTAVVIFDVDDRLAANDELRNRFRASEGAVLPSVIFDVVRAVHHRDVAAIRATLADDFELVDHRPLGVERMDADGYVEFFASLVSETSDSVRETMHLLRISPAGAVEMARFVGHTLDGAVYEIVWTQVTVVRDGRLAVLEMYPPEDVDAAVARFDELADAVATQDSRLRNTATRAMERWIAALEARDRQAMIASVAASFVYDDRRSLTGVPLDRAGWISTQDISIETNLRLHSTTLSTLGDRLAMAHERWRGESAGTAFDGENLTIREVDAEGRITAIVTFDLPDRVAANDELWKRFGNNEEGHVLPGVIFDAVRAWNHRDVAGFRATVADDLEMVDHRVLGVERMSADEYAAYFESLISETSDVFFESMYTLRLSSAGAVHVARISGHTLDGASFELVFTQVALARDGRLVVAELYAPENVALAVARFDELTGAHEQ